MSEKTNLMKNETRPEGDKAHPMHDEIHLAGDKVRLTKNETRPERDKAHLR
ncbi:MAG: hypothetical protein LBK65_06755 [Tannerellaceae bacterium]|nr:hypothetical protein [Tannerellaceae bacterium]